MKEANRSYKHAKSVVIVGAGGNIGSHLVPHIARLPDVRDVCLIDPDVYEPKNLSSQDIVPDDVGRPKADVQADRLRRINPDLEVTAVHDFVENVPLGKLRCDLILAALDSLISRQFVNQSSWRLGIPWIDAGVRADGLFARLNVYMPSPDAACIECSWDERHYRMLEQAYPCQAMPIQPDATNAPSSLGALASSLQALECQKILSGEHDRAAIGKEILVDALNHRHYVTKMWHNPDCRFDHTTWDIEKIVSAPRTLTVGQALELGKEAASDNGLPLLRVEGEAFVRRLACSCGQSRILLHLHRKLGREELQCRICGREMLAVGFDMTDRLTAEFLPNGFMACPLQSVGFRDGDVFAIETSRGVHHYEIDYETNGSKERSGSQ